MDLSPFAHRRHRPGVGTPGSEASAGPEATPAPPPSATPAPSATPEQSGGAEPSGAAGGARPSARAIAVMAMLGFATAWNAGNIGPVASELAAEFDTSLAAIGLLSGTVYFLAAVLGILVAAQAGERLGLIVALRISLIATIAGNVLIAITPIAGGFAAGRVLAALSLAWVPVLAPVWARQVGGIRLIGYFGASFQLGIAGALAVGAVLA